MNEGRAHGCVSLFFVCCELEYDMSCDRPDGFEWGLTCFETGLVVACYGEAKTL